MQSNNESTSTHRMRLYEKCKHTSPAQSVSTVATQLQNIGDNNETDAKRVETDNFLKEIGLERMCCEFKKKKMYHTQLVSLEDRDIGNLCTHLGGSPVDTVLLINGLRRLQHSHVTNNAPRVVVMTPHEATALDRAKQKKDALATHIESITATIDDVKTSFAACETAVQEKYKSIVDTLQQEKERRLQLIQQNRQQSLRALNNILATNESGRDAVCAVIKQWHEALAQSDKTSRNKACDAMDRKGAADAEFQDCTFQVAEYELPDSEERTLPIISFKQGSLPLLSALCDVADPANTLMASTSLPTETKCAPVRRPKRLRFRLSHDHEGPTCKKRRVCDETEKCEREDSHDESRSHQRWTPEEDTNARKLHEEGLSWKDIAQLSGRSEQAVKQRLLYSIRPNEL